LTEAEDRRQKTENRSQETGDRRQETVLPCRGLLTVDS
jgi:hypothetical protein